MSDQLFLFQGARDRLYQDGMDPNPFQFNGEVAAVFDDMLRRSIPLYLEMNHLVLEWVARTARAQDRVVDIGCSTGTLLRAISLAATQPLRLVGLDTSPDMIDRARQKCTALPERHTLELTCFDALQFDYGGSGFVCANYVLQFLPVNQRKHLLQRIYRGLRPSGVLFLSEKLYSPHVDLSPHVDQFHRDFKRTHGYSDTEIARKKEAVDQALIPLTIDQQLRLLHAVGFRQVEIVLKWHQFTSFVAIKDKAYGNDVD